MKSPLDEIIERQDLNQQQLPSTLIGHEVVMAMMMPDQDGLLPRRHIVVLKNPSKVRGMYSTHYVAYQPGWNGQDGPWVCHWGHYDKGRKAAIRDMIARERYERGPAW